MLVKSMNCDEMFNELKSDLQSLILSGLLQNLSKTYKKFAVKSKSDIFPYKCKMVDICSIKHNQWHMINYIINRKNDNFSSLQYVTKSIPNCGIEAYRLTGKYTTGNEKLTVINVFIPHLFQRYKERNNLELSGYRLIEQFFIDNCAQLPSKYTYYSGDMEICSITKNGIILGKYENESKTHIIWKTYISENEMNEEQFLRYDVIKTSLTTNLEDMANHMIKDILKLEMNKFEMRKKLVMFEFVTSTIRLPFDPNLYKTIEL